MPWSVRPGSAGFCGNSLKHPLFSLDLAVRAMSKYSPNFTIKMSATPTKTHEYFSYVPWCYKRSTCSCQAGMCRRCTCRKRSRRPFLVMCCQGVKVSCNESCLVCCECVRMVYTFTIREEPVLIPSAQQRRTFDVRLGLPA